MGFSITTNGTLLTEEDAEFFESHGFAVTVSLDGPRETHNALRPYKSGAGSFDAIMRRVQPLLTTQRRMQVSARVTVTPANLELRRALDQFIDAGFHSVGFSPMLSAPNGSGEMQEADLKVMLGEMIDCGREFERRVLAGERYPFANMANAMREIGRGTHRPYPCGAGAGYLGRLRRWRVVGLPSFRRRRSRRYGFSGRWRRFEPPSRVARRSPCASPRAVPRLLGALPVRRRVPPRSYPPRPPRVRLHSRLAALLPRGIREPLGAAPGVVWRGLSALRRAPSCHRLCPSTFLCAAVAQPAPWLRFAFPGWATACVSSISASHGTQKLRRWARTGFALLQPLGLASPSRGICFLALRSHAAALANRQGRDLRGRALSGGPATS